MEKCLGEYVKRRRREMGLSLREFGKKCGMSHTHIDSIEKGFDVRSGKSVNLTGVTIRKLADALDVEESWLMNMYMGNNTENALTSNEKLKLMLFGDLNVTDEELEEVKRYAEFVISKRGGR